MRRRHVQHSRGVGHLVDQAIAWAARTRGADAVSQAALRRSLPRGRRRSTCYVSRLIQLGDALTGLPPLELALYRSPRLTYASIAKIVRRSKSVTEMRAALRQLIAEPGRPKSGPRRRRRLTKPGPPRPALDSASAPTELWDARLAAADPLRAVANFAKDLQHLYHEATTGLDAALARRHQRIVLAGQSLASLMLSMRDYRSAGSNAAHSAALLPREQRALEELKRLGDAIERATRGVGDLEPVQREPTVADSHPDLGSVR